MVKYVVLPEQRVVYAILRGSRHDALRKINRMIGDGSDFCVYNNKYLMPDTFKAKAVCDSADEWNEEIGKNIAKAKVLKNYYRSLDKRLDMFRGSLIDLNSRVFETPANVESDT